jgi:acyl carrier protein
VIQQPSRLPDFPHIPSIEEEGPMATTEEIRSDLAEIVNEVAGVPADDVQLEKSVLDDLDVDSLSMVEVVVAAEEKFGVTIPDDEVKNLSTVGDAVSFIEKQQQS